MKPHGVMTLYSSDKVATNGPLLGHLRFMHYDLNNIDYIFLLLKPYLINDGQIFYIYFKGYIFLKHL